MADKYYLWSEVVIGGESYDQSKQFKSDERVKIGEEVTQDKLNATDEDWQYFLDEGVVRTEPYPETNGMESPRQAMLREANDAMQRAELGLAPETKAASKNEGTIKASDKTG